MGISFAFRNNVQIIKLDGVVSAVEEAAIRLKLEEKISQGRQLFLLDISGLDLTNGPSVQAIHTLFNYLVARETFAGCFGLKKQSWVQLAEGDTIELNKFETEAEGQKWLHEKLEAKQKAPDPNAQKVPEGDPEEEFKQKKIKKMLEKYELYQTENDYDPFMLVKTKDDYKTAKFRRALILLQNALDEIEKKKISVADLDLKVKQTAVTLKTAALTRKIPISAAELENKRKSVKQQRDAVDTEVTALKNEINKLKNHVDAMKQDVVNQEKTLGQKLVELQNEVQKQKKENDSSIEEMTKKEKEEEAMLKKP